MPAAIALADRLRELADAQARVANVVALILSHQRPELARSPAMLASIIGQQRAAIEGSMECLNAADYLDAGQARS